MIGGYRIAEQKGLSDGEFNKIKIVIEDRKISFFQNDQLTAITSEVKPSTMPLKFGAIQEKPTEAYEFRNIRIFDSAVFPAGYAPPVDKLRNYGGDGFFMHRVDVKDASLPRILVVGDSISGGYQNFITEHFKDKAYVDFWIGGHWFGETARGPDSPAKRAWDGVLANGPYDAISWNAMTLHMWNGDPGRCDETTYPANMTEVVQHIQKTAPQTKFIWVRCTPVRTTPQSGPVGLDPVRNGIVLRLNAVTDEIMKAHGIPIVDAYGIALPQMHTIPEGSQDAVHWGDKVYAEIADAIIKEIEIALTERKNEK